MTLERPTALAEAHRVADFESGVPSLDDWLKRRALTNQRSGASRTFVALQDGQIVGYYALAAGAVAGDVAVGRVHRNMPEPVPVAILARLAVAQSHQHRGLGRALFRDAALRVVSAADTIGIRGFLVHAISEDAKRFYLALGLAVSPLEPMTLMTTVADLRAAAAGGGSAGPSR